MNKITEEFQFWYILQNTSNQKYKYMSHRDPMKTWLLNMMKHADSIKGQRKDFRSKLREYDDGQLDSALSMEASLL